MTVAQELGKVAKVNGSPHGVRILKDVRDFGTPMPHYALWQGDVEAFLDALPREPIFDLVVTSPPYNIGKPYEKRTELEEYLVWQSRIESRRKDRTSLPVSRPNG